MRFKQIDCKKQVKVRCTTEVLPLWIQLKVKVHSQNRKHPSRKIVRGGISRNKFYRAKLLLYPKN